MTIQELQAVSEAIANRVEAKLAVRRTVTVSIRTLDAHGRFGLAWCREVSASVVQPHRSAGDWAMLYVPAVTR